MPRVCVIGSANVDYAVTLPRLPRRGETVTGGTLRRSLGGKGANQAVAARRLGAEVRMIGCVGRDDAGERLRAALAGEGIDVSGLAATEAAATGTALIHVGPDGANQIGVASGANALLDVAQLARHANALAWAEVLVCQLEVPLEVVTWGLERARRHGTLTVLNPAPARPLEDALLGLVDVLVPNEGEARLLAGREEDAGAPGIREAARRDAERLLARGAAAVIVTLGGAGALALRAAGLVEQPAFSVQALDTTGAGDAFTAALAVALASGASLETALARSAAAGALACTRPGAQDSLPTAAAVDALLAR